MKTSLILLVLGFTATVHAAPEVIYGQDNRQDVFESRNSSFVELSKSTAGMISKQNLVAKGSSFEITGPTLESRGICSSERFASQISAANCSGFIVSDSILVTAGHCIKNEDDCASYKWVFDYKLDNASEVNVTVPASDVYGCSKIISRTLDPVSKNDYAVIQLDRKVTDRRPLHFRRSGRIARGDALVLIGHPSGLPTKIADGAAVRSLSSMFFVANTDSYGGNSGSAVLNAKTGDVEGILVRGENDYVSSSQGCMVSNQCTDDGCRGEDVTYITNIDALKNLP